MDKFKDGFFPSGLSISLSNSVIKRQEIIHQMINPPIITALEAQQSMITKQSFALQSAFSVSELVSKSLATGLSAMVNQTSLLGMNNLIKPLTESIRLIQMNLPSIDHLADITRSMTHSLQNMTDAIIPMAEQMSKITQGFTDAFSFHIFDLIRAIPPFEVSKLSEAFDHIKDFEEKNELLKNFGWFLISELPEEIVDTIYEQRDEITQEEVDTLIIQYFRNNKCVVLKQMVSGWRDLPYFESRRDVFHQAQVCHSRRTYNASTTLLSLHFEGIVTDFVRENMSSPTYRAEKALESVTNLALDMPLNVMPFTEWIICRCVLDCIDTTFTTNFSPADPESCPNSSRHKIAHGHATEKETEANSLRRFLYMNEMYKLFSCLERELQVVV